MRISALLTLATLLVATEALPLKPLATSAEGPLTSGKALEKRAGLGEIWRALKNGAPEQPPLPYETSNPISGTPPPPPPTPEERAASAAELVVNGVGQETITKGNIRDIRRHVAANAGEGVSEKMVDEALKDLGIKF